MLSLAQKQSLCQSSPCILLVHFLGAASQPRFEIVPRHDVRDKALPRLQSLPILRTTMAHSSRLSGLRAAWVLPCMATEHELTRCLAVATGTMLCQSYY